MKQNYTIAGLIAGVVVALDLVTKRWAAGRFTPEPVDIWGEFLKFRFVENTGAAFSMFQGAGPVFGVAAIVIVVAILWLLHKPRPLWEVIGMGFVIGGASGNLIDRLARGEGFLDGPVIDWINLWFIPTFNIADASVTVAVAVFLIGSWRSE